MVGSLRSDDLTKTALMAALTGLGAFIKVPLPYVPFTLQVTFVLLAGALLGSKLGALSQMVYLSAGLAGLPIFANGGGPSYVLQPTFGYLIGFVFAAFIAGWGIEGRASPTYLRVALAMSAGLMTVYLFGVLYLYLIINFIVERPLPFFAAIKTGALIFLPADLLLTAIAAYLFFEVRRRLREGSCA